MERCGLFHVVGARIERMESKQGNGGPLVIVALLVLVLASVYVAGYFCLSEESKFVVNGGKQDVILRHFKSSLACWAYKPAARIEGRARGIPVKLWHTDPFE